MTSIILYGIQRSGTNFLQELLKKNFKITFFNSEKDGSDPAQKHCRLYENKEIIPHAKYRNSIQIESLEDFETLLPRVPDYFFIISKDPYSWLISYQNWAKRCRWKKAEHHYLEEYNLFYGIFRKLAEESEKFIFICYRDLLNNPKQYLESLSNQLKFTKHSSRRPQFIVPKRVAHSQGYNESKKKAFLDRNHLARFSAKQLEKMNQILDGELMDFLGYEMLAVEDLPGTK